MKRLLIVGLVAALVLVPGALWFWARASLPAREGEQRAAGLRAPVEVLFDGHGVPHVYASGPEDAWFAAGMLHARDRFWQMELYRRAAHGRLSEILGEETLPIDRRFLTLDLRGAAQAEWNVAAPAVREALTRYAAGVNAQLAGMTGRRRPLELQILGVTPAPWTPIDSLAVSRLLAWRLAENHQAELVRQALASRFGVDAALRLGGQYPASAPTVVDGGGARGGASALPAVPAAPRVADSGASAAPPPSRLAAASWPAGLEWLHPAARRGGSNNWVIAGQHTESGRPLLANDPHLQVELPGVWYEMHLVAAGLDVIGVTVPGTPFVVLGHNARIAWGMTNTGADVQDLFIDRLDLRRLQYFYAGQWRPVQITRSDIPVRGGSPQPFEVWRTRHGTVFADVGLDWEDAPAFLSPLSERRGERRVFTLRWDTAGETAAAFEMLNRAGSWSDFTAAIQRFAAPSQNVVFADIEGNIGYAMSGALPRRSSGTGALPSDGVTGQGEWTGTIHPTSLPRLLNPARGFVTSSNNLVDRRFSGGITRDWAAPYRAARLQRVLEMAERVNLTTAAAWQTDITGLAAADVLAEVDAALAVAGREQDRRAADVLARLRAWDRQIDRQPIVTLYHLFEDALWRRTFMDEMGSPLFERFYEWAGAERPAGLYAILDDRTSRWFDDIGTLGRRETREDVFVLAAHDAAVRFASEFGGDRPWDEAHAVRFAHPLGTVAAPLGWLFNRGPVPLAGDTFTVNRASYHRLRPFTVWETTSWRQLFDVGRWDESRVIMPAGQSGHPLSPHYFDQSEMWRRGEYRRQPFSRAAVDEARQHRLLLVP